MKKMTNEEFIKRVKGKHGDKFDYSKVVYTGAHGKVTIICPKHGEFKQSAHVHIIGSGCPECAGKNPTTEKFIKKAKEIHSNKYDYSKVEYKTNSDKVMIICPIHGEFLMEPRNHLRSNSGCGKCKSNVRLTNKEFIKKAKEIHGNKYDYSKVEYENKKSKVTIICPIHGEFEQIARYHTMSGCGCQKCGYGDVSKARSLSLIDFIKKSEELHDKKYDYSKTVYKKNTIKVTIICPIHGEFKQRPKEHLRGCGCPKCKESKGEKTIREFLIENNINFEPQYKFDDCKNILSLPFDFYLPELNMCIEYNGAQHYKPVKYWGGEKTLKEIKKRDNIKKQYCINNNIKLMIIRYNEKIENKLYKILFKEKPKRTMTNMPI